MKKIVPFSLLLLFLAGVSHAQENVVIKENAVGFWHVTTMERMAELKKQGDPVKITAFVTAVFSDRAEVWADHTHPSEWPIRMYHAKFFYRKSKGTVIETKGDLYKVQTDCNMPGARYDFWFFKDDLQETK